MKVSFDYDYTLDRKDVQRYATELVNLGFDVWVVTSRFDTETALSRNWTWIEDSNLRLFSVVEKCGIPKEKVVFTNMESKSIYIDGKGFIFHLDDCDIELGDMNYTLAKD